MSFFSLLLLCHCFSIYLSSLVFLIPLVKKLQCMQWHEWKKIKNCSIFIYLYICMYIHTVYVPMNVLECVHVKIKIIEFDVSICIWNHHSDMRLILKSWMKCFKLLTYLHNASINPTEGPFWPNLSAPFSVAFVDLPLPPGLHSLFPVSVLSGHRGLPVPADWAGVMFWAEVAPSPRS